MQFINGSEKAFNTIHANNYMFYEELADVIAKEPIDFIDPELRGLAASMGIRKDKPFAPDARMKAILTDVNPSPSVNATARAICLSKPVIRRLFTMTRADGRLRSLAGDYKWLIDGGIGGRRSAMRALCSSIRRL